MIGPRHTPAQGCQLSPTRWFRIMLNMKVIGTHSNIHTNIIFINMGLKITVYTKKYPDPLFILLEYMQLLPKHPLIFFCSFYPCVIILDDS